MRNSLGTSLACGLSHPMGSSLNMGDSLGVSIIPVGFEQPSFLPKEQELEWREKELEEKREKETSSFNWAEMVGAVGSAAGNIMQGFASFQAADKMPYAFMQNMQTPPTGPSSADQELARIKAAAAQEKIAALTAQAAESQAKTQYMLEQRLRAQPISEDKDKDKKDKTILLIGGVGVAGIAILLVVMMRKR